MFMGKGRIVVFAESYVNGSWWEICWGDIKVGDFLTTLIVSSFGVQACDPLTQLLKNVAPQMTKLEVAEAHRWGEPYKVEPPRQKLFFTPHKV